MTIDTATDLFAPVLAEDAGTVDLVTVRPGAATAGKQGLATFIGVSGKTAGARAIAMHRVVLAPGQAARAHRQDGHETVLYVVKGRIKTLFGDGLRRGSVNEAGDFLYVAPNVPYKPVNLNTREPAELIAACTDPDGQDSMTPYPEPFTRYGAGVGSTRS